MNIHCSGRGLRLMPALASVFVAFQTPKHRAEPWDGFRRISYAADSACVSFSPVSFSK